MTAMTKKEYVEDLILNNHELLRQWMVEAVQPEVFQMYSEKFLIQVKLSKNYIFQMELIPDQKHMEDAFEWLFTESESESNIAPIMAFVRFNYLRDQQPLISFLWITQQIKNLFDDQKRLIEVEDVLSLPYDYVNQSKMSLARDYMYFQLTQVLDSLWSLYSEDHKTNEEMMEMKLP